MNLPADPPATARAAEMSLSSLPADVPGDRARLGRMPNLIRFMRNPAIVQLRWAESFRGEPVVTPVAGDARIAVVYGRDALRHLCTRQGEESDWVRPEGGGVRLPAGSKASISFRGISTSNGSEHAKRRRPAMAVTHGRARLAPLEEAFARTAQALVEPLAGAFDGATLTTEFSLRNSLECLLGVPDDALARSRLKDIDALLGGFSSPFVMALQRDWPLTPYRRLLQTGDRLYDWAARVIEHKMQADPEARSVLGTLIHTDERDEPPTVERLIGDAVNFYVVGHASTAQQIAWALMLLAAHPREQAEVQAELREVLSGRSVASDDALPLFDGALNEALRLLPATHSLNPRVARVDVELPGARGPRRVPAGAIVFGALLAIHHDREHWPEPKRFRPARWADGWKPDPYVFLPFGQGARRCVGDALAWSQLRALVATVLQHGSVSLASGARYDYAANVVQLAPRKMPLRFTRGPIDEYGAPPLAGRVARDLLA